MTKDLMIIQEGSGLENARENFIPSDAKLRTIIDTIPVIAWCIPIPVGGFPQAVATTPDGTHVYVTNSSDNTVSVIDTSSNKVVATIPVGSLPDGVAITPDRTGPYEDDDPRHQPLAYVTNGEDNTVSVINTAKNTVVKTIPVGAGPSGVAITSDGPHSPGRDDRRHQSLVYVTNQLDDTVSVIETANNTVVATITVGGDCTGVAITPDGTHAYVVNLASLTENTVSVIDTANNTVVATITVGFAPYGVAITPDETDPLEHDDRRHPPLAYVTNTDDSIVSVINTANNKVVATIPVGTLPFAVAFATVAPSHR